MGVAADVTRSDRTAVELRYFAGKSGDGLALPSHTTTGDTTRSARTTRFTWCATRPIH